MSKRRQRKAKASTRDVLGSTPSNCRPRRIPPRWRAHYDHLVQLRDEILAKQATLKRDAMDEQPTFSLHMADAGTDSYDRDFALGMLSNEQDAVYEIDQAIDRIWNGTYGICEMTGKPIDATRLEVIPWTRFRADAEKQIEKEGGVKRAGLGPRDTVAKTEPKSEQPKTS